MAKKFEFKFDLDEDEETWLTPQLSERTVGTQSKPVDLKEWFAQIPTSDRASLLSKKLQKYAQKRAARKGNERLRSGQSVSLDIVTEENGSPQSISPNTDHQNDMKGAETAVKAPTVITTSNNVDHISQQERNDSGIANNTDHFSSPESTPSSAHSNSNIITSTPMPSGDASNVPSHLPLSSIQNPASVGQILSDSDDEFYDASSDFIDNPPQQLMTSSLHEDQLNGNGMLPDDSGISVVRNSMTQSLMKVEEETPASQLNVHTTANSKPVRASSVSPRPTSTFTAENRPVQPTVQRTVPPSQPAQSRGSTESIDQSRSLQTTTVTPLSSRSRASTTNRQQVRLSRPTSSLRPLANHQRTSERPPQPATVNQSHGGSIVRVPNPKAQLLQALISTPTTNNKERDRNSNLPPSHDHVNSLNNRPVSAPRPSPQTGSDIPDLAALQELARQQEEALRQAVERQQHGNIERKHSWQNDANSRSVHSSAGSLVSSKSADMSALHRVNANPVSRIPGPTRLPRKSGIPAPAKRIATPARCASAVPQPTYDDECF